MASYSLSPSAHDDLDGIHSYIAEDDVENADLFIDDVLLRLQMLAKKLKAGRVWDRAAHERRVFPFKRYLIFYIETKDGIDVSRIIHGARDIDSIFDMDYEN